MTFNSLENFIGAAGGTRFCMCIGAGAVNTLLLVAGYLTGTLYRDLTLGTVGVYIAARAYQVKGNVPKPADE